eukprot:gene297-1631_t
MICKEEGSTNIRVWWAAITRCLGLITVSVGQVIFIRRLFMRKEAKALAIRQTDCDSTSGRVWLPAKPATDHGPLAPAQHATIEWLPTIDVAPNNGLPSNRLTTIETVARTTCAHSKLAYRPLDSCTEQTATSNGYRPLDSCTEQQATIELARDTL